MKLWKWGRSGGNVGVIGEIADEGLDPVWNAANCRNRRLFNDRTGLGAGRNTRELLLQTYRRDMGGGVFAMMKDCSAPIYVNGRHWSGLRMGYRV